MGSKKHIYVRAMSTCDYCHKDVTGFVLCFDPVKAWSPDEIGYKNNHCCGKCAIKCDGCKEYICADTKCSSLCTICGQKLCNTCCCTCFKCDKKYCKTCILEKDSCSGLLCRSCGKTYTRDGGCIECGSALCGRCANWCFEGCGKFCDKCPHNCRGF